MNPKFDDGFCSHVLTSPTSSGVEPPGVGPASPTEVPVAALGSSRNAGRAGRRISPSEGTRRAARWCWRRQPSPRTGGAAARAFAPTHEQAVELNPNGCVRQVLHRSGRRVTCSSTWTRSPRHQREFRRGRSGTSRGNAETLIRAGNQRGPARLKWGFPGTSRCRPPPESPRWPPAPRRSTRGPRAGTLRWDAGQADIHKMGLAEIPLIFKQHFGVLETPAL